MLIDKKVIALYDQKIFDTLLCDYEEKEYQKIIAIDKYNRIENFRLSWSSAYTSIEIWLKERHNNHNYFRAIGHNQHSKSRVFSPDTGWGFLVSMACWDIKSFEATENEDGSMNLEVLNQKKDEPVIHESYTIKPISREEFLDEKLPWRTDDKHPYSKFLKKNCREIND